MRNKRKLREYDNNIKVGLNETPMQKNFYKKVEADLDKRRKILIENSFDVLAITVTWLVSSTSVYLELFLGMNLLNLIAQPEGEASCSAIEKVINVVLFLKQIIPKVYWNIYGCNWSFIIEDWPWALCTESQQLIREPTRITTTSQSLIDVCWVTNDLNIVDIGTTDLDGLTDHQLIFCKIKPLWCGASAPVRYFRNLK
ncbi:hypothetical protein WA026_021968 [Henosepilachna vigintioctopunctata]|uniref:Endonuclease/exonuclease/phosphatase domain-containing protein n=1 Tax=Henosepilachna vigintioctopunctata TaxID=420089 RepID=A0AAW1VHU3_9CUCU